LRKKSVDCESELYRRQNDFHCGFVTARRTRKRWRWPVKTVPSSCAKQRSRSCGVRQMPPLRQLQPTHLSRRRTEDDLLNAAPAVVREDRPG
jgi:hypothetical protein